MPHNCQAIIENVQIKWLNTPPSETTAKVIVTVLSPVDNNVLASETSSSKKHQLGFMQGEMTFPDDINWGDNEVKDLFVSN